MIKHTLDAGAVFNSQNIKLLVCCFFWMLIEQSNSQQHLYQRISENFLEHLAWFWTPATICLVCMSAFMLFFQWLYHLTSVTSHRSFENKFEIQLQTRVILRTFIRD